MNQPGLAATRALPPHTPARAPAQHLQTREILRVSATLGTTHPDPFTNAIQHILTWAQRQIPDPLPEESRTGESFALDVAGRDPQAIRLRTADSDLWAFRMHQPDAHVPGRAWTSETVLGRLGTGPVRLSTRLLATTPERVFDIEPAVPRFLTTIAATCGLIAPHHSLHLQPITYHTRAQAADLAALLLHPDRSIPVIVLSCPDDQNTPLLDADRLASALLGLADIAVLSTEATWGLTERFGKRLSVFGGAARIYFPGFSESDDPFRHRLILAASITPPGGRQRAQRMLREEAARESLRHRALGTDVLSFAAVRAAHLALLERRLANPNETDPDRLRAAHARIKALEEDNRRLQAEIAYYLEEYERERARAEAAEAQAEKAAWRIQQLLDQMQTDGTNPDADLDLPQSWTQFASWCDEQLAGRLVLTPSARRGVRKPAFHSPETAAQCLLWLATHGRDRFRTGGGRLANVTILPGLLNAPCGADAYEFRWGGRIHIADWHIKTGGNTRDPTRCLRIYYAFDPQTQQILVSDMPAHRTTDAS